MKAQKYILSILGACLMMSIANAQLIKDPKLNDRIADHCTTVMQLSADISSDIQQLIAFTARGGDPFDSKQIWKKANQTQVKIQTLQKYLKELHKLAGKHKEYLKMVYIMQSHVEKTLAYWPKFEAYVVKGAKDAYIISSGGAMQMHLSAIKDLGQELRRRVRSS